MLKALSEHVASINEHSFGGYCKRKKDLDGLAQNGGLHLFALGESDEVAKSCVPRQYMRWSD